MPTLSAERKIKYKNLRSIKIIAEIVVNMNIIARKNFSSKLDNNGVLIYSKQNLIDKGYPSTPSSDLYLMYGIKEEVSLKFNQVKFNLTKLDNFKNFRSSPIPITINLTELLDKKIIVK